MTVYYYYYHANWPKKRRERLKIDDHKCQTCLHDGSHWQLEIHHKTYERFGHEDVERDLITLCAQCHKAITNVLRKRRYEDRKHSIEYFESQQAKGELDNGMERKSVQVDWHYAVNHAQRAISQSVEQVDAFDQGDFFKETKNRRGL